MHTLLNRANAIFAFSLTLLAAITILFAFSTSYKSYEEQARVNMMAVKKLVRRIQDFNMPDGKENDLGLIQFNLDADFNDCFDWNVKQLFLYLTANYETKENVFNQIVLWDHIIERGQHDTKVNLVNKNPKYYMWDDGFGLRGNKNVTLTLSMNIVPNAGFLQVATSPTTHSFAFPDEYLSM